jgi:hypothetical protein
MLRSVVRCSVNKGENETCQTQITTANNKKVTANKIHCDVNSADEERNKGHNAQQLLFSATLDRFLSWPLQNQLTLTEGIGAKAEAEATRAREQAAVNFMVKIASVYEEVCDGLPQHQRVRVVFRDCTDYARRTSGRVIQARYVSGSESITST